MTDPASDPTPAPTNGAIQRLWQWRWPLFLFLGILLVLAALGAITWWAAAACLLVVALLVTIVGPEAERQLETTLPVEADGPDAATIRFAEALPDPCILIDGGGIIRFCNARAMTNFPFRIGDLLTARLRAPDIVAAFHRVAAGGGPAKVEFAERVPTERWFAAWFAPLDGAPGEKPSAVVLIIEDLTEGRRGERIRVDFVANASHELRTPLASLAGFIETLQGPAKDDVVARDRFLAIMHGEATRMSRLIDDLLSLSRIEMKAHMRPQERVDIVALIRNVIDALEPLAAELNVAVESELPNARVVVAGDADELVQVFSNLLENALKYGRTGKRVVVSLIHPGGSRGSCLFSVRDFGPGIPAEHLPRLTERFYRVDFERQNRGTGLGLAIVKHIVNRHRARMTIESEPGQGALFSVRFDDAAFEPLEAPEAKKVQLLQ